MGNDKYKTFIFEPNGSLFIDNPTALKVIRLAYSTLQSLFLKEAVRGTYYLLMNLKGNGDIQTIVRDMVAPGVNVNVGVTTECNSSQHMPWKYR